MRLTMNYTKTEDPRTPILNLGGSGMMAGKYTSYDILSTSNFLSSGWSDDGSPDTMNPDNSHQIGNCRPYRQYVDATTVLSVYQGDRNGRQ